MWRDVAKGLMATKSSEKAQVWQNMLRLKVGYVKSEHLPDESHRGDVHIFIHMFFEKNVFDTQKSSHRLYPGPPRLILNVFWYPQIIS